MKITSIIYRSIAFFVLAMSCFSCASDEDANSDCSTTLCANSAVIFEFIDADTEEDLFLDGGFSLDDLQIINQENGALIPFSDNRLNPLVERIFVFVPDPENEVAQSINYSVLLPGVFDFTIQYEVAIVDDPCCTDFRFSNFQFEGASVEQSESVGQSGNGFLVRI